MPTTQYDIVIPKGSNFKLNVRALNSDGTTMSLVGYLGRFQVRSSIDQADPPLLSGTTENGMMTINGPGGVVMINVPANVTEALSFTSGLWDCEVYTDTTNVNRVAEGFASLSLEVTR